MAKRKKKDKELDPMLVKTDAPFKDEIQKSVVKWLGNEFDTAEKNMQPFHDAFSEYDDMVHCVREKKNDWEPDIYLPEFTSRLLSAQGDFVNRYFASRDFVECRADYSDPHDVAEAKASKTLLNVLLNKKDAHYYYKIVRGLMFTFQTGWCVVKGGYDQEVASELVGYREEERSIRDQEGNQLAQDGLPYADPYTQRPLVEIAQVPVYEDRVVKDTPTFEVYPNQDVFFDNRYAYTLQDKEYVIFHSEETLDSLREQANRLGYFNLDRLDAIAKKARRPAQKETGHKTYNKDKDFDDPEVFVTPIFDIYERWGKWPVVVNEYDDRGKPVDYEPGIDENGDISDDAVNLECILTWATYASNKTDKTLIRFQVSTHSKRPMARFICYIDTIRDSGFGDGETVKELQYAANDTFNLNAYRTRLATTPAFKAKKYIGIDENIQIRPDKAILLEDTENDLKELIIRDDIQGGMYQLNTLAMRMDDVMATGPNQRGIGGDRRETATVGAIMDKRADIRLSLKSTTLEWTGFSEFYDMLLTLCNDFMLPETLESLIGENAYFYNPNREDRFIPVSQSLETEESKNFKVKMWQQVLSTVVQIPNPKTPLVVNYILGQILELMGGDFKHFKRFMLSEDPTSNILYMLATGSKGAGQSSNAPEGMGPGTPQNQQMIPQSAPEQAARGM